MYKIMELYNWVSDKESSITYRASCCCGDENCDLTIDIEYNPELNSILLRLYQTVRWADYYGNWTFFQKIYKRIFSSLKVLFLGELEMYADLTMDSERQIDDFCKAIQDGKKIVKRK